MCFAIKKNDEVARVTPVDITVYKILEVNVNGGLYSPTQSTSWTLDLVAVIHDLKRVRSHTADTIDAGLHSLRTLQDAKDFKRSNYPNSFYKICTAVIPKGALYWENATQYVSDRLTVKTIGIKRGRPAKK